jgi:hypothetical protein
MAAEETTTEMMLAPQMVVICELEVNIALEVHRLVVEIGKIYDIHHHILFTDGYVVPWLNQKMMM